MRFGSPHASGFGSPDNHVAYVIPEKRADDTSALLRFKPRGTPEYGDAFFQICRNARFVKNLYAPAGEETKVRVSLPWGADSVSFSVFRIGHLGDPLYQNAKAPRYDETTEGQRVTLEFTFVPEPIGALSDGGFTSAWALAGLVQGGNCKPLTGHPAWGTLALDLAVAGGVVTVTLKYGATIVAQGSATILGAPFSVTLTAQNSSGLSGSLTVSNTVIATAGATLYVRWPLEMKVKRGTSDPPTAVVATVPFAGRNLVRWTEGDDLAAATYFYRVQPNSDTDDLGTESASVSVVVPGTPAAPTGLAYSSGGAAATVLSFIGSATPGATYRAYVADIGAQINLNNIGATAPAGSSSITLPVIAGSPGTTYCIVRAVNGGVEERNLNMLALEYDAAGAFVAPRPNTPGLDPAGIAVTAGLTVAVPGTYDPTREKGVATKLQLFTRTPTGAYNYAAPDAQANLGSGGIGGLKTATPSFAFVTPGFRYVRLLAATAAGTQSPSADAPEVLVYVSDVDMPAASGLSAAVARG